MPEIPATNPHITPLARKLARRIEHTGPITLADFMRTALLDPEHGYYQRETAFGRTGDFITSPDISQMFGEMLALYLADRWQALGQPKQFYVLELGGGRGTLMRDIVRTAAHVPGLADAVKPLFLEAGSRRIAEQTHAVPSAAHIASLSALEPLLNAPDTRFYCISNEFFDALPVHQFEYTEAGWRERGVGLAAQHGEAGASFTFLLLPPSPALALMPSTLKARAKVGDIFEVSPQAQQFTAELAKLVASHKGGTLFIDYGHARSSFGDTFQAVFEHSYSHPLERMGEQDLTAHIDFEALLSAALASAPALQAYGADEQGAFLMGLGMGARAQQLAKGASTAQQQTLLAALKRLTATDAMGTLFKVAAFEAGCVHAPPCLRPFPRVL